MTPRRFSVVATTVLLAAGLLLSGCDRDQDSTGGFQALDQQQAQSCDGLPPPATLALLDSKAAVTSAVVCTIDEQYFPGEGSWEVSTVREVPADRIAALVAGLRLPDVPTTGDACTASLAVLPDVVLTFADGNRARPAVAGDGCHPRRDALTALDDVAEMPAVRTTRTKRVRSDIDVVAGCGSGGMSPAAWPSAKDAGTARFTLPSAGGNVSVCRYQHTADQEGTLAAAGIVPAGDFARAWPDISSAAPAACSEPADLMKTPAVDWVLVLQTPRPPYHLDQPAAEPIALVELGGCHRVVDPNGGLAGFIDASGATALAALADQPAS